MILPPSLGGALEDVKKVALAMMASQIGDGSHTKKVAAPGPARRRHFCGIANKGNRGRGPDPLPTPVWLAAVTDAPIASVYEAKLGKFVVVIWQNCRCV